MPSKTYSIGASKLWIRPAPVSSRRRVPAAIRVDLPDPGTPVTSVSPRHASQASTISGSMPSSAKSGTRSGSTRITTFIPNPLSTCTGEMLTRNRRLRPRCSRTATEQSIASPERRTPLAAGVEQPVDQHPHRRRVQRRRPSPSRARRRCRPARVARSGTRRPRRPRPPPTAGTRPAGPPETRARPAPTARPSPSPPAAGAIPRPGAPAAPSRRAARIPRRSASSGRLPRPAHRRAPPTAPSPSARAAAVATGDIPSKSSAQPVHVGREHVVRKRHALAPTRLDPRSPAPLPPRGRGEHSTETGASASGQRRTR